MSYLSVFGEVFVKVFGSFYNWVVYVLLSFVISIFVNTVLYQTFLLQIFTPGLYGLSSQSLDIVFCREVLNFNEDQFISYFLNGLCLWCCI